MLWLNAMCVYTSNYNMIFIYSLILSFSSFLVCWWAHVQVLLIIIDGKILLLFVKLFMMVFVVICDAFHCYLYVSDVVFCCFLPLTRCELVVTCVVGHKEPKSLVIAFLLSLSNPLLFLGCKSNLGPSLTHFLS